MQLCIDQKENLEKMSKDLHWVQSITRAQMLKFFS